MSQNSLPALPQIRPHFGRPRRSFATFRSVAALMLREMSTQYGRNPGGYVWALLEPLGSIVMMSLGFSLIIREPPLGTSFLLFYATGTMPFGMFNTASGATGKALQFSRPLLAYPAVTWVDAIIARLVLNSLTSVAVSAILLTAIIMWSGGVSTINLWPVMESAGLAALLGLGIGCMNAAIGGLYPTWMMVWNILTRPLMIASGVIFLYSDLPRSAQDILWYNPLIHIIGLMRSGFYPMYHADYVTRIYVICIALPLIALGLLLLRRYHKDILSN
ncbi:MAG: ABC transporter permease [Gemmobacter sp.]